MSARARTRRAAATIITACLVGHAFASYRGIRWLQAATRCPLMVLLAGYAANQLATDTTSAGAGGRGSRPAATWPLVAGLVCSAAGDTVLMRESDRALLAGIGAFLGTHACYLANFVRAGALSAARRQPLIPATYAAAYLLAAAGLWRRLGALRLPVLGYGLALFSMAAAAGASGPEPGAGAALFVLSDLTIGLGLARYRFRGQQAVIATTYVAGQFLITHHWLRAAGGSGPADARGGR